MLFISELLGKTKRRKWFTRLDLKDMYNLIRLAAGDEVKTTFCNKQELFEYTVMPLDLTNAPELFQEMINTIFNNIEGCI